MATKVIEDRVRDTSTSTGTGTVTVSGVPPQAYRTLSGVCAVGDAFPYSMVHRSANEWETGLATYSAANQFTRSPIRSSNSNNAVNFSTGTKDVILSVLAASAKQTQWGGNVLEFDADPTGATDSLAAFNKALACCGRIYAPDGKYLISGPLTMPARNNAGIIGDGSFNGAANASDWVPGAGTVIISSDLTSNLIDYSNASGLSNLTFRGFTLTRTSQSTTGTPIGMRISRGDRHDLRDLQFDNHGIGLHLGFMGGYAYAENIVSQINKSHGIQLQGQWQLHNVFSASNGGDGFNLTSPQGLGVNSSGQWSRLSTYNNTGWGFNCAPGSAANGLEGFRISDSFFGNDLTGELNLDSYGENAHKFTGCQFEGNDGVQLVVISGNNPTIMFTGCYFTCGGTAHCIRSTLNGSRRTGNKALCALILEGCSLNALPSLHGSAGTGFGVNSYGSGGRTLISNCQIDGFRDGIVVDDGAGGTGTSQHLNVSNCSIYSMGDVFSGAGVVGIFMQSTGGRCNIQGCQIGASSATAFTTGIIVTNSGTGGAVSVTGCGITFNGTSASLSSTITPYNAGNF